MRKLLLSLCLLSAVLSLSATSLSGIRVESAEGPILVFIDGQQVCTPTMSCFVANLSPGNYRVEVYASHPNTSREHFRRGKQLYNERFFYNGRNIKEIYVNEHRREGHDDFHGQKRAMSPDAFSQFFALFKKGPFESDRMALLNTTLLNSYFTSQQCLELTAYYSFDDEKMKVMQKVYPKIIDKQNFFLVIDVLSFSRNKDKMNDFLEQYHSN